MSVSPYYQVPAQPPPNPAPTVPAGIIPANPWTVAPQAPAQPVAAPLPATPWPAPTAPAQPAQAWPQPWTPAQQPHKPALHSPFAWLVIVAGLAAIAISFAPNYYQVTSTVNYFTTPITASTSVDAWHGTYGWLAAILLVVAALPAVIHLANHHLAFPVLGLLCTLAGLACAIVAHLIFPPVGHLDLASGSNWLTIQTSYGWGYWAILVCAVIAAGGAALTLIDARQRAAQTVAAPTPVLTPPPAPAPAVAYATGYVMPNSVPAYAPPTNPAAPVAPQPPAVYAPPSTPYPLNPF